MNPVGEEEAGGGDDGACYMLLLKASARARRPWPRVRVAGQQGAINALSLKLNPSFAAVEAGRRPGCRGRPRRCAVVPVVAVGGPRSRRRMSCL